MDKANFSEKLTDFQSDLKRSYIPKKHHLPQMILCIFH